MVAISISEYLSETLDDFRKAFNSEWIETFENHFLFLIEGMGLEEELSKNELSRVKRIDRSSEDKKVRKVVQEYFFEFLEGSECIRSDCALAYRKAVSKYNRRFRHM
jgi:hypothetical protein